MLEFEVDEWNTLEMRFTEDELQVMETFFKKTFGR
jgi:hypothetical protein